MVNKKILLFIPTLNEEKHIKIILEKLEVYSDYFDLLVIDDNSTDNTVKNFYNHKGDITKSIIIRKNNFGIGSAHLDAIKYAKEKKYMYILTMDCDLTHEPRYISNFLKLHQDYDFLVGSRYLNNFKESFARWAMWRIILSYSAHYVCSIFLNIKFDTTSGFRMYKLECLDNDFFNFIIRKDYSFFIESGFFINKKKMKVREIAVNMPTRKYGTSKMKMKHLISSIQLVFKLWLLK